MKTIQLTAETANLNKVIGFVTEQLESSGCPMKVLMQIELAVEEIFVNIANYAYGTNIGNVAVSVDISDEKQAVITFEDSGVPYDPLAKSDPDLSLSVNERQIGGLGIFMAKKSMDKMHYEYRDGKNILTLVKETKHQ